MRRDIAAGALYIWRRPQLRFMMALLLATIVVGSVFRIVLPRYMVEVLDRPAADQGLLLLVYGLGAAAAGLIIAGLATSRWAWPVLLGMIALMGLGHFMMGRGGQLWACGGGAWADGSGVAGADDAAAGEHHDTHGAGLLRTGDELHDDGLGLADAESVCRLGWRRISWGSGR